MNNSLVIYIKYLLLLFILFFSSTAEVSAQCTIGNLVVEQPIVDYRNFGSDMANIGDLDGDGTDDIAFAYSGAYNINIGKRAEGGVVIHLLNADGSFKTQYEFAQNQFPTRPTTFDQSFGSAVTGIGDLDGDGVPDIVIGDSEVGGTGSTSGGGFHVVLMNSNGTIKSTQSVFAADLRPEGSYSSLNLGYSMANLGDLNGDGVNDLAVGAPTYHDIGGPSKGGVYIFFMNSDGTVQSNQLITEGRGGFVGNPGSNQPAFGVSIANLGDLNGDGVIDLAVGASNQKTVYILFMNSDGTVQSEQAISSTEDDLGIPDVGSLQYFGRNIANLGDLDGDGIIDIGVGTYNGSGSGNVQGAILYLFLNADGTVKSTQILSGIEDVFPATATAEGFNASSMGGSILNMGDPNGTGFNRLLIGGNNYTALTEPSHGIVFDFDISYVNGRVEIRTECPGSIVNTIAAQSSTACLNDIVSPINNVSFDLVSGPDSRAFDGAETGVFQWQVSYNNGADWENIQNATLVDMTEEVKILGDTYFRRYYFNECCDIPSFSNEVMIEQTGESPIISVLPLHYCPGAGESEIIRINVSGGQGPFTYSWSPTTGLSDPNIAEPTITFGSEDIYELTVTGADGCVGTTAAVMIPIQADAGGATIYSCNEGGVEIGMSPIPGISGVIYSWTLAGGGDASTTLSCIDCSNPIADPASNTTYVLSIADADGCTNTSQIEVFPNAYRADAGPDVYVCQGTNTYIGTPAETGIFYGWSPGNYINRQNAARPYFYSGERPSPNPYLYTLTTFDPNSGDCYSVDSLLAHVAWADAGVDDETTLCLQAEQIGTPDCCNGQATYEWTVVSGDANSFYDPDTDTFSTTSDIPQPFVLPTTQLTTYQVRVTWGPNADNSGGADCTDLRYIRPDCGDGCPVTDVEFINESNCGIGTSGTVLQTPLNTVYWDLVWTSVDGTSNLSCTDCPNPELLNDVTANIVYTLTYTSKVDPNINCFFNVDIFNSASATPSTLAQGGVSCAGNSVNIGNLPVAGWSYEWSPTASLDDPTSSNPSASPSATTSYELIVTDDETGCQADTTVTVSMFSLPGVTGGDITVCAGETAVIGSPAVADYTYQWTPSIDLSNPNIAQPTATVNGTRNYFLTVTAPNGCTFSESAQVSVSNNYTVIAPNVSTCSEQAVTLSAEVEGVSNGNLLFNWSPATNLSSTTSPSPTASGLTSSTSYTVSVTSLSGGCLGTATVNVTVNPLPNGVTLNDVDICNNPVQIGTSNNSNFSYKWLPDRDLSDSEISNPTSSATSTTTYVLTVTSIITGCSDKFEQTVTPLSPQIEAGEDLEICVGERVSIGAIPAEAGATYSWSPTTGLTNPTNAQTTAEPAETTTYILTASKDGCTSMDEITITVIPEPAGIGTLDPFVVICENDCQMIGINNNPAYLYQWLPASAVSSPNSSMTEICPTGNRTVTLIVSNPATGCDKVQDMSVFLTSGGDCPVLCGEINKITDDVTICSGDAIEELSVSTTFNNTNSIRFVYFTSPQTDASVIYSNGTLIDTAPISSSSNIVTLTDVSVSAFVNNTSTVATFYVYAIVNPLQSSATCRPYQEVKVMVMEKPETLVLCDDASNNAVLTAQTGLTGVTWFNSADTQVGTGNTLSVDSNTDGLSDGTEEFYYTAVDGNGCAIELCCPVTVMTETCCEILITQNIQSVCNDNGTNSDPSDDYFTVEINATVQDGGGLYEVVTGANVDGTGGTIVGISPYGTSIVIGNGGNFSADGTTTYNITVRDGSTNTCHQNYMTTPVNSCSDVCALTITQNVQSICNNDGTESDASDDYFTIDFNATAQNGGTLYEVVTGANADGTGGTIVGIAEYGTSITVGNAGNFTADGTTTYSITVRDGSTNTCHQDYTTTPVNSCSDVCALLLTQSEQSLCINNGTNSDPSDDYFTIDFNATAQNGGTLYEIVTGANADGTGGTIVGIAEYGTPITVGSAGNFVADDMTTYDITIRDGAMNTCHQDYTTMIVRPCSDATIDYPDYENPIRSCDSVPCHEISDNIYLGSGVSGESEPSGSQSADTDVDDGVLITPKMQFTSGNTVRIPVVVYNNTGNSAYLRMWIDWNGDGDFEDAGEQVEDTVRPSTGTAEVYLVEITIPLDALQSQDLAVRTRLSTDGANSNGPCGTSDCAVDGEIEDYLIQIDCPVKVCTPVQLSIKPATP